MHSNYGGHHSVLVVCLLYLYCSVYVTYTAYTKGTGQYILRDSMGLLRSWHLKSS